MLESEKLAMSATNDSEWVLPRAFLRMCRRNMSRKKVADTSGMTMTGAQLLLRSLVFRRILLRDVLGDGERFVGLLLPPSGGGMLANAALSICGRVGCNLNYTLSSEVLNSCIARCGMRHVLTSRRFMERVDLDVDAELVFLEDLKEKATTADKITSAAAAYAMPISMLERSLGLTSITPDDMATVIFTSGSTGEPKGVVLSHRNVLSNVRAMDEVASLRSDDVFLGILPFFHAFGFTCTMWGVLTLNFAGAYHYSPLEAETIGKLCRKHDVTIVFVTPTLLRRYLKRCPKEDLATAEVIVCGAEPMPISLAEAVEKKFGVRPVEGYGATECSPLISCNIPEARLRTGDRPRMKEGTVGPPIPGVEAQVVDLDTRETLQRGEAGMLEIRGPNVMQGYYEEPEKTADVIHDGWYSTGDMAVLDEEGFIKITGRLSRFSKLGGEMVPHLKIEEAIARVIGAGEEDVMVAVTAVPDERKGERIVVLHKSLEVSPQDICHRLADEGMPNLWVPSPQNFCEVDEFPLLGTGKLDLKLLRTLAEEKFPAAV